MNNTLYITLFISLISVKGVASQERDTSAIIYAVNLKSTNYLIQDASMDTSLFQTHFYNPADKGNISVTFLGNTGQAFINNNFFSRNNDQPFIFHKAYDEYFHTPFNTLHFNTKKPFTELRYVSSGTRANSEQVLNAIHTQNVNQYTNFGIKYDAISSRGIYLNQDSRVNFLTLFGSYDKENYSIYISIHNNKFVYEESGGLNDINKFIEHKVNDPLVYDMKFADANSTGKNTTFFFTQTYKNYASKNDSLEFANILPKGMAIFHTFNYSRYYRSYDDVISTGDTVKYYENNFYGINSAKDSVFMHLVENSVRFSITETKKRMSLLVGAKHQFQEYDFLHPYWSFNSSDNEPTDTIISVISGKKYYNLSVTGNIGLNIPGFKTDLNAEYFFAGYRQHDLSANILLNKIYKDHKTGIALGGSFNLYEPDFLLKNYGSSHFIWKNDLKKTVNINAFLILRSKNGKIYAKGETGVLNNYIYFNRHAIPAVKEHNLYLSCITLGSAFEWGILNHNHDLLLQKASDTDVVRIPLIAYRNSTYLEKSFFKKALIVQLGFDLFYNTAYYSDTYNPALGIFHLQDTGETGNYPFLNGFLIWKVKRTRFFLNYTNILAGIAGHNYFTAYGYPMFDRSLKFGLAWTFYD